MEDTSSASSDSDNALLSPRDNTRVGRNAATQTPELPRHEMAKVADEATPPPPHIQVVPEPAPSSNSITVYRLDAQRPLSELEQEARSLAIPDVVVEYIRGSVGGEANAAFEPHELIVVRTPSSLSLRDDSDKGEMSQGVQLSPLNYGDLLSPASGAPSRSPSSTSLRCPSPSFGYRPLESETSAVYTIIAPVRYSDKQAEARLMEKLQAQMQSEKDSKRKFEFCPAPLSIERKRHRLQCLTDTCSTCFLVPGILIAVVTPVCLIPMFMLPLKYMIPLMAVFVVSGCTAVLSLAVSSLIGNIVWHYDDVNQKLRPRLHCGTGPIKHFWGNGFYPLREDNVLKDGPEKI